MSLIIDRGGTHLDHVAIGVPDTAQGVEELAGILGYRPILTDPEPDQFYWSGALPMGSGKFLEILGPNPAYKKFNPFIEKVKRLDRPRPLFWYVATNDFNAFQDAAKRAGAPIERIETVTHEKRGVLTDYTRGYLGPGFLSVSPNVIEWRSRFEGLSDGDGPTFLGLGLSHPEADRLNRVFKELGVDKAVSEGPHRISLKLGIRNGEIEFSGEGLEFRGVGALLELAKIFFSWALKSKS